MAWFRRREEEEEDIKHLAQHAVELHGVPVQEVVHAVLDEADDDLDDEDSRGSKVGILVTLGVVGIAFGLGIVFLIHLTSTADQRGPDAEAGPKAMKQKIAPTPAALPSLVGQFISFSYPQVFDAVKNLGNWPTSVERYSIGSAGNYRRSIIVTVEKNTPNFEDDSGYKYRSLNPSLYHSQAVKTLAGQGMVMIKNDNTERTLFLIHGAKMAVISVTSTNSGDDLLQYVGVIANTVRWVG
jgi:hypothetical protein